MKMTKTEAITLLRDAMKHITGNPNSRFIGAIAKNALRDTAVIEPDQPSTAPASTLGQQVTQAKAEYASWPPELKASVQIEGRES